jgi:hypothetical protein
MRRYLNRLFGWRAAYADLRRFLGNRQPHQYGFFALSLTLVGLTIWAFTRDSHFVPDYHPDIIYVQSWPNSRTDAEIIAQQRIDQVKKEAADAELAKRQAENQAALKRIDNKLRSWGI